MTTVAIRPAPPQSGDHRRRVRVWFGSIAIADYIASPDLAAQYEAAMTRRFQGLRVTNEPLHKEADGHERELPSRLLWELPPH